MSCCCFLSAKMKAVLSIILILDAMLIRTIHDLVPCKKKKKKKNTVCACASFGVELYVAGAKKKPCQFR